MNEEFTETQKAALESIKKSGGYDKRYFTQEIQEVPDKNFEGTVQEVIEYLDSLKEKYSDYRDLRIEHIGEYEDTIYVLKGEILESDEQYDNRMKTVIRQKLLKEEKLKKIRDKKLAELERLKAKYDR